MSAFMHDMFAERLKWQKHCWFPEGVLLTVGVTAGWLTAALDGVLGGAVCV